MPPAPPPTPPVVLRISGMHCGSCAARLQRSLAKAPGVREASVNFPAASARVSGDGLEHDRLIQIVRRAGFEAELQPTGAARATSSTTDSANAAAWKRRAIIGLALWLPAEALHWLAGPLGIPHHAATIVIAAAAAAAQVLIAPAFYRSALSAARARATNMDTLVSIGVAAAFTLSLAALILQLLGRDNAPPMYFAESTALLAIISLGHWLEARATASAGAETRNLLTLRPGTAECLEHTSSKRGVTLRSIDIAIGDLIRIPAGSRFPVDGTIELGDTTVDESIITGEPVPVPKPRTAEVVAGSVNTGAPVVIRATRWGHDTTIDRMARLVEEAQAGGTNLQKLADRVSSVFVPAVLMVALATLLAWGLGLGSATGDWSRAFINATTVLVISCPCALGLATPTAIMVGIGAAAKRGILVRSARGLERLGTVRLALLDKTGTITEGRPSVVHASSDEALAAAAALAAASTHPLSGALRKAADDKHLALPDATEVTEHPGSGLSGTIGGGSVRLRAARPGEPLALDPEATAHHHAATWSVLETPDAPPALIGFFDQPKPDASVAVRELRDLGVPVRILSGDRTEAVAHLAAFLGLSMQHAEAGLAPERKVERVRTLAETDGPIAMVGDGLNDAAALAAAESSGGVAVAMDTGADLTAEHASLILPGAALRTLPRAVMLARAVRRTIKQNLVLSFAYNTAAIPAAALGLLGDRGPLIAAAAMGLSSLCVVGNSLRLRFRLNTHA